jgi:DNA-binding LacI/PurR family transcriptional regulator
MAETRPKVIGLLTDSFNAVFVHEALPGLEAGLAGSGCIFKLIELEDFDEVDKNRRIERIALERQVDALLVCHLPFNSRQAALFIESRIPVGLLANRLEGVDWCMCDEIQGAYEATRHLLAMGHRRIALLSGPPVALESRLREDGFLRALREAGIPLQRDSQIKILNFTQNEGYEAGHLLMRLPDPPTAVFCSAGDLTALGLMTALREWGLRIPHDVSVVGYDGLSFGEHLDPPLTTVKQPLLRMAHVLAERLAWRLKNPGRVEPLGEFFEPVLVLRSSTALPVELQTGRRT